MQSLCVAVSVLAISQSAFAVPSFIPLGDFPGGSENSAARGVSADGRIVVGQGGSIAGPQAFRYDEANGLQGLEDIPGGAFSNSARDVSADGSVVVGIGRPAGSGEVGEAITWDEDGLHRLGDLPGGRSVSQAYGVSANGLTVVGRSRSDSGYEAFVWDAIQRMRGIGDLPGGDFNSIAFAASADGSRIVGRGDTALGSTAFLYDEANGIQSLSEMTGEHLIEAIDISEDGSVVVGSGRLGSFREAFRYTVGGSLQPLGELPGGIFESSASAVSLDGRFVVGTSSSALGPEVFIHDDTSGMRALSQVLESLGVDLTGWSLRFAGGVSADGRVIVGTGINPSGNPEAFIAMIPEPSTAGLVALGLVGVGVGRRR